MTGLKKTGLVGLLVSSLLWGSVSVAWAEKTVPDHPARWRQVALQGEVRVIEGTTITVDGRRGEVTVLTDDATRFRLPENDQGSLADVQIGDRVAVRGRLVSARVVRAQVIFVDAEGTRILRGTVDGVVDDVINLVMGDGTIPLLTDENTRVFIPGIPEPSVQDLEIGTRIVVAGRYDTEGTLIARTVKAFLGGKRAHLRGEVTAIETGGFRLDTRQGELSIRVDHQTRFRIPDVNEPSLNDLSIGTTALVAGFWNDDGSVLAKIVAALPQRPRRARVVGRVITMTDVAVNLELSSGNQVNVQTDEQTRFWLPGVEEPGLDDFEIGQMIGATGHWEKEGGLHARIIVAPRSRPAAPASGG